MPSRLSRPAGCSSTSPLAATPATVLQAGSRVLLTPPGMQKPDLCWRELYDVRGCVVADLELEAEMLQCTGGTGGPICAVAVPSRLRILPTYLPTWSTGCPGQKDWCWHTKGSAGESRCRKWVGPVVWDNIILKCRVAERAVQRTWAELKAPRP